MTIAFIIAVGVVVYGIIAGIVYTILEILDGFYPADDVYIAAFWPFFVPFLLSVSATEALGEWLSDRRYRKNKEEKNE